MPIRPVFGEIKAQSLNDNFSYLDSQVESISIGPFDTYTSLAQLNAAYPNGRQGFAIVLESDGKTGYMYTWTGTQWKKGGLAQAQGIADGQVTRKKTNYYNAANDIYNSSSFIGGGYYNATTGAFVTDASWGWVSIAEFDYISYRLLNLLTSTNRHVTYWSDNNFISGESVNVFNPPANTKEIRVSIRVIEKDQVAIVPSADNRVMYKDDELFVDNDNISKKIKLDENNMNFLEEGQSLINKFYKPSMRDGGFYHYQTGSWESNANYFTSNHISVVPGDILRSNSKGGNTLYTNFWKADGTWLFGINKTTEVVVPNNAATVTSTFNKYYGDDPDNVMIVLNISMPDDYVPWKQYTFSKSIYVPESESNTGYLKNDLKGAVLIATGDSIVSAEDRYGETIKGYIKIVADYFGMTLKNYAISGSTIAVQPDNPSERTPLSTRYQNMSDDGDVIYVQCGTNDWNYQWTEIGTMNDRTVFTFYGALHVFIDGLMAKYPGKQIIFGLPIKRRVTFEDTNDLGMTLWQYCEIIKKVCGYYSIPIIDLYNRSMMNPHVPDQRTAYLPDATHPNRVGHEILALPVISYFKNLVLR